MKFKDKSELEYVDVASRIQTFRDEYKDHKILTSVVKLEKYNEKHMYALVKAEIQNADNFVIATGNALEVEGSNTINKTSFLENAETSAVGRALAFLGIGSSESVATKEEVEGAKEKQQVIQKKETVEKGKDLAAKAKKNMKAIDLSFIPKLVNGKRSEVSLKKLGKGLVAMGITKPVATVVFNRYDADGKYGTLINFYTTATVEQVKEFILKVKE